MATFSNAAFNAASYAAFRPTYPPRLLQTVAAYHAAGKGNFENALDLGCGTGQVTKTLPQYFGHVVGADPSPGMVKQATSDPDKSPEIEYVVSLAESVDTVVPRESVDLITAGQAAHWFDYKRLWPVLANILKPGGTVAFWGYSEFRVVGHPELTQSVNQYSNGRDSLGPYWEQPGRSIVDNHLRDIAFPSTPEWDPTSARRIHFAGEHVPYLDVPYHPLSDDEFQLPEESEYKTDAILNKKLTWKGMESYLRTWSSLHTYQEKKPDDKQRTGKGRDGDIVDRYIHFLKDKVGGEAVEIQWPLSLMLIRKAQKP